MRDIATGAYVTIPREGRIHGKYLRNVANRQMNPNDEAEWKNIVWKSWHFVAFSSHGEVLLAESEGVFTMDEWDDAVEMASHRALGRYAWQDRDDEEVEDVVSYDLLIRQAIEKETMKTTKWKGGI